MKYVNIENSIFKFNIQVKRTNITGTFDIFVKMWKPEILKE